jgi:hypothetical protein
MFVNNYFEKDLFLGKITQGGGGFGAGGSRFGSGIGGSGGSGGNVWVNIFLFYDVPYLSIIKVRTGKKFLPAAARYGKRYYQRRKYNKGMYAGMGAGTGYYAGSHMGNRYPYGKYTIILRL